MMFRHKPRFVFAAALFALAAATPAAAQSRVQVGVLECRGNGAVSFVVGSVNDFACIFRPERGRPHSYLATIRRFGVDLGVSGHSVLTWLVFAPSERVGYGALAGTYVGPSAGLSIGVGLSGNALVGGSGNTFGLQPVSVGGGTGVNVAAGIAGLELSPARPERPLRHRHRG
jgi:Protein of unknown function (DUF992)